MREAPPTGLTGSRRRAVRGDRRRRLQRGGLPGPADHARGARLAHVDSRPSRGPKAEVLRAAGRAERLGQGPRHRRGRRDPRRRHRPPAQQPDPRPAHPQGDPPQRRQAGRRHRAPDRARRRRRGDRPLRPGPTAHSASGARACRYRRRGNVASAVAETLRDAESVVVIWGERIGREGERRRGPARRRRHRPGRQDGSGLLEIPDITNARGLREAGCLPDAGPRPARDTHRNGKCRPRRSARPSCPASSRA